MNVNEDAVQRDLFPVSVCYLYTLTKASIQGEASPTSCGCGDVSKYLEVRDRSALALSYQLVLYLEASWCGPYNLRRGEKEKNFYVSVFIAARNSEHNCTQSLGARALVQ